MRTYCTVWYARVRTVSNSYPPPAGPATGCFLLWRSDRFDQIPEICDSRKKAPLDPYPLDPSPLDPPPPLPTSTPSSPPHTRTRTHAQSTPITQ